MEQVRAQVLLTNITNIMDEELMQQGQLSPHQVRTYEVTAQVDTGTACMVLAVDVVYHLGLRIRGQRVAEYAYGLREAVDVVDPVGLKVRGRETIEEALVLGDEVLIGQSVLEKLDLHVDAAGQRPDQTVTKVK